MFLERAGAVSSLAPVVRSRGNLAKLTHHRSPILESNAIFELNVRCIGLESRNANGFPPTRKLLEDVILLNPRFFLKFSSRRRVAHGLSYLADGIENGGFVDRWTGHWLP